MTVSAAERGLVDTSIFVADESGRALATHNIPRELGVSVITIGELQAGVLIAADTSTRAQRLATLQVVSDMHLLPIDEQVALHWARLRVQLVDAGRRMNVNDAWIAATALTHALPVVTQDDDFDVLQDISGLQVIKV